MICRSIDSGQRLLITQTAVCRSEGRRCWLPVPARRIRWCLRAS